jgi:NAD(P)-dependent dehydrogenase (short-subunit alcohol dehydrogenase family)
VPGALLEAPLDEWRRLFDVNVLGVVLGLQALIPAMREQGQGAIAVVCSISSFQVELASGAYCASKGALLQVVRAAALEHACDGLRINAVCPGIVDTPLLRRFVDAADDPAAIYEAMERRTPTGRMVSSQEVADVLQFLVGPRSGGLSGAALTIDGGLTTTYDFDAAAH